MDGYTKKEPSIVHPYDEYESFPSQKKIGESHGFFFDLLSLQFIFS
jgi:hypothetical protein